MKKIDDKLIQDKVIDNRLLHSTKLADKYEKRISKYSFGIFDEKIYIDINSYEIDMDLHLHEFYEIVYIIRGSATHIINNEKHSACMGDLFLLDYNTAHTIENMSSNFKMIAVSFLPEIIDESLIDSHDVNDLLAFLIEKSIFDNKNNAGFIVLHACAKDFEGVLDEMFEEFEAKKDYYRIILKNQLSIVLGRIYRFANQKNRNSAISSISSVVNYLEQHYNESFKLSELAKIAMLSPSYLSAQFKLKTGISLSNYSNSKRIENACRLLNESNIPISCIMNEVGFNDPKFFYKVFKRYISMTPGEYRKNNS